MTYQDLIKQKKQTSELNSDDIELIRTQHCRYNTADAQMRKEIEGGTNFTALIMMSIDRYKRDLSVAIKNLPGQHV